MNASSAPFNNGTVNAGVAGTLAALAYCDDIADSIPKALPGWSLAWRADQSVYGNYAYVAQTTNQFVVAIRGSETDFSWSTFYNWVEQDLNVMRQVAWQYPSDGQSMISWGSSLALGNLAQLVDSTSGQPVSLLQYLMSNAVANGTPIAVVGHSLGGNLTTVLAPWLVYQIQQAGKTVPSIATYTFAAPAAGNTSFAQLYDRLFGANSWRFYNMNDIVPRFSTQIASVGSLWTPAPNAGSISTQWNNHTITLTEFFDLLAGAVLASELYYGSYYSQTNLTQGSVELNTANTLNPTYNQNTLGDWFDQAGWQHSMQTYLSLLGAPGTTCVSATTDTVARDAAALHAPRTVGAFLDARVATARAATTP